MPDRHQGDTGIDRPCVLLTGASGLVGRAVVSHLKSSHWRVRGLTHSAAKADDLLRAGCDEVAIGDVTEYDSLARATDGADGVIHSVGLLMQKGRLTYESMNVGGTKNAIKAAEAAGASRFVMMSVVGLRAGDRNPYAASKWECEQALKDSRLDWTILRSSYICGPGAPVLDLLKKLTVLPVVPIVGAGTQLMQMVSSSDVAHCLVAALDLPETENETYELCGPVPLTYDELIDLVAAIHGKRPPLKVHVPYSLVKAGLPLAERLPGSVVSRATIDMLLRDNVCDPRDAAAVFGLDLAHIDDCLRDAYERQQ